ncbi:MAG: hypothetical protein WDW36_001609 [Sanguina aurantia]
MIAVPPGIQQVPAAQAFSGNPLEYKKELKNRKRKVPESEYTDGPDGLKIYDIEVGTGALASIGSRVAIHYEVKWRGITFMTSRMGLGVTGGNPMGFDVGTPPGEPGSTLAGLDLGVRGMRVGGLRKLLVPPELGYGKAPVGEIPANSTLSVDVELLSIKTNPFKSNAVEAS